MEVNGGEESIPTAHLSVLKGAKRVKLALATGEDGKPLFENHETCKFKDIPNSDDSAVPCLQAKTNPKDFEKAGNHHTPHEVYEMLKMKRRMNMKNAAVAELCPVTTRIRIVVKKWNIECIYGYDYEKEVYLHPEEALFLLETGRLLVKSAGCKLSVQKARELLLRKADDLEVPTCTPEEYIVYKHFAKLGYRLRRRKQKVVEKVTEEMETTKSTPTDEENSQEKRGTKRRGSLDIINESSSSGSSVVSMREEDDVVLEDDSDCEFIESVERGVTVTPYRDGEGEDCDEFMDVEPTPGPSSGLRQPPPPTYYVQESDSDVEILDEVIYSRVHIVEISSQQLGSPLADPKLSPNTSSTDFEVIVNLVSSDEEEDIYEDDEYETIWNKCVPGAKLTLSFPPSSLIPSNIIPREGTFEFGGKGEEDEETELDLPSFVDNLHLDQNPSPASKASSWKDWRQNLMAEARGFLNESLLGGGDGDVKSDKPNSKLNLWKEATEEETNTSAGKGNDSLNIPFYLYPPTGKQFHRKNLGVKVKPTHNIVIVRDIDIIPDFVEENDIPYLIVILSSDSIVCLLYNQTPLPPI